MYGIFGLQNSDKGWIKAVSDRTEALNLDSDLLNSRLYPKIEPQVILAAEKQDPSIGRVFTYKPDGYKLQSTKFPENYHIQKSYNVNGQSWKFEAKGCQND